MLLTSLMSVRAAAAAAAAAVAAAAAACASCSPAPYHPHNRCFVSFFQVLHQLEELGRLTELGTIISFAKLISGVLILCHWFACLYFLICYQDGFDPLPDGWAPPEVVENDPILQQYLIAFVWSVDVVIGEFTSANIPETNLQRAFQIIVDFAHVLVVAFFIGSVEQLLSEWNRDAEEFRLRMLKLNQFMGRRRLNKELQNRIRNYYFHAWSRQGAFDNPEILSDLPVNLRQEVHVCTHGGVLGKVPLFKNCDQSFLNLLTEKVKLRIYAPGDAVMLIGEEGDEMFFLNRGEVVIENKEGRTLATLGEGSVIGEVCWGWKGNGGQGSSSYERLKIPHIYLV